MFIKSTTAEMQHTEAEAQCNQMLTVTSPHESPQFGVWCHLKSHICQNVEITNLQL